MTADGIGEGHMDAAATHAATDQRSKLDQTETSQKTPNKAAQAGRAAA